MTTPAQLAFDVGPVFAPIDQERAAILDRLLADKANGLDRAHVINAILHVAARHLGVVDPNLVRVRLTDSVTGKLKVKPQIVGPTYRALVQAGVLVDDGWVVNSDRAGGNAGKPAHRYRRTAA